MRFHTPLIAPLFALAVAFGSSSTAVAASSATPPAAAEDLIGLEVEGALGEELGQVAAVSESPDGEQTLLIEVSGMLDLGHAVFPVRRSQVQAGPTEDVLTYPVTAADVRRIVRDKNRLAAR